MRLLPVIPTGRRAAWRRTFEDWRPRWLLPVLVGFVVASTVLLGLYLQQDTAQERLPYFAASRVLSVVAFAAGTLTARKGFRRDWFLMLAAVTLWAVGDLVASGHVARNGHLGSWVWAGAASVGAFVLMAWGALGLARRDGFAQGAAVALDSIVFAVSSGVVWWVVVGQAVLRPGGRVGVDLLVASYQPAGDALLFAAATALLSSRSSHALSSRVLAVYAVAALVGDLGFGEYVTGEVDHLPAWVPAAFMVQFALAGAAALLSGMPAPRTAGRVSSLGIFLVVGSLLAPLIALTVVTHVPHGRVPLGPSVAPVVVIGTGILLVLVVIRMLQLVRRVERQARALERSARTDWLTGLPNRRAGVRLLGEAITSATEHGDGLAVAIVDLDHFKSYNDTFGHQRGDALLRAAAQVWAPVVEGCGVLYRYGGEEFVLLLPGHSAREAEMLLGRMRRLTPHRQTFSAGVAMLQEGDDAQSLVGRADASLYAAKASGRARTMTNARSA